MKIHIELSLHTGTGSIEIPIHYNHIVQGAIYHSIDKELAAFLHDKGFTSGSRTFRMFSFSGLYGQFSMNRVKKTIAFTGRVKLTISSPVDEFCQSVVSTLLTRGSLTLNDFLLEVQQVQIKKMAVTGETVLLQTLSPIVLYSTLLRADGRKYTCYFQPRDPDYEQLLGENLRKKYQAIYNEKPPLGEITVKPVGEQKLKIINYKGFIIKGYAGRIRLEGPQPLLQMAVDGAVGGKNSQGFGCVKVVGGKVKKRKGGERKDD